MFHGMNARFKDENLPDNPATIVDKVFNFLMFMMVLLFVFVVLWLWIDKALAEMDFFPADEVGPPTVAAKTSFNFRHFSHFRSL